MLLLVLKAIKRTADLTRFIFDVGRIKAETLPVVENVKLHIGSKVKHRHFFK